MHKFRFFLVGAAWLLSVACGTNPPDEDGSGGGSSSGGRVATGGAGPTSGGSSATGGTNSGGTGTGGSEPRGGSGGKVATGGTSQAGTSGKTGGNSSGGGTGKTGGAGGSTGGVSTNGGTGGRVGSGGSTSGGNGTGGSTGGDPGGGTMIQHKVTFYGFPDNDPPSANIAYPQLHQSAGGIGTYDDPITFASSKDEWKPGTKLYVPYLKRYVIMEDYCQQCITDWGSKMYHIDIWLNSDASHKSEVISCEEKLTKQMTDVEINPPANRTVVSDPLFDIASGTCKGP